MFAADGISLMFFVIFSMNNILLIFYELITH
jgi:hypothetical protein